MKDWYMDRTIKKMDPAEKKGMMNDMMDKFFESMTPAEKKELMNAMMPRMMDKMFEGMGSEDKLELMATMMPRMMSQMFGGAEGAAEGAFRMPACGGAEGSEGEGSKAPGDFKPWEMCPCRTFCEHGKKGAHSAPLGTPPDP